MDNNNTQYCETNGTIYFINEQTTLDAYPLVRQFCRDSFSNRYNFPDLSVKFEDTPCLRFHMDSDSLEDLYSLHNKFLEFAKTLPGIYFYEVNLPVMVEHQGTWWQKQ